VPREANEMVGKEYNDRGIGRHERPTVRDDDDPGFVMAHSE
jgi:hypothetical protein